MNQIPISYFVLYSPVETFISNATVHDKKEKKS